MSHILHEMFLQLGLLLFHKVQGVLVYIATCHTLFDERKEVCLKRHKEIVYSFLLLQY